MKKRKKTDKKAAPAWHPERQEADGSDDLDFPAMMLAAFLVILPVAVLALCGICLAIWLLIL